MTRETVCLSCGMIVDLHIAHCPKCDNRLADQHDGSTITVDIAHGGETVRQALAKLERAIDEGRRGYARYLRVIVGTGLIRNEVEASLTIRVRAGAVSRFEPAPGNRGAYIVDLRG